MVSLTDIQKLCSGTIKLGEHLAAYSSLGVGGPADYVLQPASDEEGNRLVEYFRQNDFPCIVMQPNLLVSDKGFRGAVIVRDQSNDRAILKNGATIFSPLNGKSATKFIEDADVNGLIWGGAEVVGNYVVNVHKATTDELYSLVHHVRNIIRSRCGVTLEFEIQLIGFDRELLARWHDDNGRT